MSSAERAKVFKALSDPKRVDIIDTLAAHGQMCGTELANHLGISLALLSHHWEVLIDAGLCRKDREGQLRYCSLNVERLREATDWCQDKCSASKKRKTKLTPA